MYHKNDLILYDAFNQTAIRRMLVKLTRRERQKAARTAEKSKFIFPPNVRLI